ncbi:hypothetical protein ABZT43_39830 [Streptomyces sp. NPDC005349]|uniref:hypothetical protein n=1 Tax=Streptomyces sp. NPDC005349 TaxID=3157037 RepID=UPI0033A8576E
MARAAVFVVDLLEQREVLLDLGDERVAVRVLGDPEAERPPAGRAVEVLGHQREKSRSRDRQEAAAINQSAEVN